MQLRGPRACFCFLGPPVPCPRPGVSLLEGPYPSATLPCTGATTTVSSPTGPAWPGALPGEGPGCAAAS